MNIALQLNPWFGRGPNGANYFSMDEEGNLLRVAYKPTDGYPPSYNLRKMEKRIKLAYRAVNGNLVLPIQWQAGFWIDGYGKADANAILIARHVFPKFNDLKFCLFIDPPLIERQMGITDPNRLQGYLYHWTLHNQYWRMEGSPVVYIWSMHSQRYDHWAKVFRLNGFHVIGDVIGSTPRDIPGLSVAGGFVQAIPGDTGNLDFLTHLEDRLIPQWESWKQLYKLLPAISCYDDRAFNPSKPTVIVPKDQDEYQWAIEQAAEYTTTNTIMPGTLDNWFEGTQTLPHRGEPWSRLEAIKEAMLAVA